MDKISIIIPNLNGLQHLEYCIPSIYEQKKGLNGEAISIDYDIIVADNGSTDASIDLLENNYPQVKIIKFNNNTGFAPAVNAGIRYSMEHFPGNIILLLNNDIELKEDFLAQAVKTFYQYPDCGIAAVKMMNFKERNKFDDTGNFITKKGGTSYPRGNGVIDTGQFDKSEYIFGACAGAAFYKENVFRTIGMFDEEFFAYLEDIDVSFRAQLAGIKCVYQPKAVCYHKRGGSTISTFKFQMKMNERNILWVRIKNYPLLLYIVYQPLFFASRMRRFYLIWRYNGFECLVSAISGYLEGILKILSFIPKRIRIQKKKAVGTKYIFSLFR
ncbi:MAG: glycosyltransferase family 2 protein [Ignavibacteria bacterium]|nr:glycosyltransferase family 2 protein [Ignavibacteria bacterium]